MRKIYAIFALLTLLTTGCEKDIMGYEGLEGVYFAVQYGDSWAGEGTWPYMPYSDVNFMTVDGDVADVTLKVMATGNVKDYDRTFKVAVVPDSTTAVEGVDYRPIQTEYTLKAGEISTNVVIQLIRTEALLNGTLKLGIELQATDRLALSFPEWDAVNKHTAGTVIDHFDASKHTIRFTNALKRPAVWTGTDASPYNGGYESGMFGAFSRKKLEFMCELFNLTYNDFQSTETMPSVLQRIITQKMSRVLIERYNAKTPVLEDDGRLMWISGVPWNSKVGVPWIPDEGYYD